MNKIVMRISLLSVVGASVAVAAACTQEIDGRSAFVEAYLEWEEKCDLGYTRFYRELEPLLVESRDYSLRRQSLLKTYAAKIASEHIRIDLRTQQNCIALLKTLDCSKSIAACTDMFVGDLSSGEACAWQEECEYGTYCKAVSSESCGTCTVLPKAGESCNEVCASGLICEGEPKSCHDLAYEGESCTAASCAAGTLCNSNDLCEKEKNSYIAGDACSRLQGRRCGEWRQTGLVCVDDDDDGLGVCTQVKIAGEGGACSYLSQDEMTFACLNSMTSQYCDADANAEQPSGICRARQQIGSACINTPVTTSGSCIEKEATCVNGICQAYLRAGDSCTEGGVPCRESVDCVDGVCVENRANTESVPVCE